MLYEISENTPLKVTGFYYIRRKTVWTQLYHVHTLVMVSDGCCCFCSERQSYELKAGEMLFIPAGVAYTRQPVEDRECNLYYLHFEAGVKPAEQFGEQAYYVEERPALGSRSRQALNVFSGLYELRENPLSRLPSAWEQQLQLLLAITTEVALEQPAGERRLPPFSSRLAPIIAYIQSNIYNKITLEDLSRAFGFSSQYIIRLFRRELNTTPVSYINRQKIHHAKEFIRTTDMNVQQIAYQLGFENSHYFSRLFYQLEGCYPTQFKICFRKKFESPEV